MMRTLLLLLIAFTLLTSGIAQNASPAPDLQTLVDTERAFARTAAEKGVRDSFLAFIADDGILFRPGPVNGKQWLTPRPPRPGLLSWQPVYADISASGDFGYTTGPWEFREKGPQDPPIAFGQFSTVWKRQPDGNWKFEIDIGVSHDKPAAALVPWQLPANLNRKKAVATGDVTALKAALFTIDKEFSKTSLAKGAVKAFEEFGADGIRVLRNGSFPILGKKEALTFLAAKPGSLSWQPEKSDVASSGDLGYTYGNYEFKGSGTNAQIETGWYMRIWKKQSNGAWRVILDVFNELPKPAAS